MQIYSYKHIIQYAASLIWNTIFKDAPLIMLIAVERSQRPKLSARTDVAWTYLPAIALALASLVLCAQVSFAPTDPHTATAVFAPWWSGERAFLAAAEQGAVVAIGAAPFLITVHSANDALIQRLRAAGAIAVINSSNPLNCGINGPGGRNAK